MNVRTVVAALLLTTMTASGVSAADRPTVKVATVTKEIGAWCLETGFIYQPGFVAGNQPPPADFETVLLSTSQAVIATDTGELPLDDCMGLGTLVQAYNQGARHTVIIAVTGIEPSYWLLGSKNVKKLADLKGKMLASNGPQTTATQAVIAILQHGARLAPDKDYTFVAAGNAGARAAALAAGKIDGISAAQPYVYNMIDEGYPVLALERQYVPDYVLGTLAVNRDWAEKNRPLLVSILKTMVQLSHWLKQPANKDAAIAKMAQYMTEGSNTIGMDYARRMYTDTVAVNGGVVDGGFADRKLFTSTLDLLAERGLITKAQYPPLDQIVDYRYLNEARRQLGMPEVKVVNVRPIAGALGAEIDGIDLAQPLSAAALEEIKRALWQYLVVFFRDQQLTPEQQCAFTQNFGALVRPAAAGSVDGHPDVTLVLREADAPREKINFGGYWHSDQSFREKPAGGFTLYAVELPPSGGDTLFENLYVAYEMLSDGMREMLDRLVAVHSYATGNDPDRGYGDVKPKVDAAKFPDVEHPFVRVHPETKRKALYLSGSWLARFRGMTVEESRPLLEYLYAHAARPEFTCRFRWTPGALALLDNRVTQHFAINDYAGHRRIMHRVMFAGERPTGTATA